MTGVHCKLLRIIKLLLFPIAILSLVVHFYVVYPHYVKKSPYFLQAVKVGLQIKCSGSRSEKLRDVLAGTSLPFFALDNHILFLDSDGALSECTSSSGSINPSYQSFRFASVTKTLTAFSVLNMVGGNPSVTLETKLLDYFPEIDPKTLADDRLSEVSLYSMMSHSSGFGGPFGSDNMIKKDEQPWCPHDFSRLSSVRLAGQPGSNSVYSNVAYCLLGEVISRQSGEPFESYMTREYLFRYPSLGFIGSSFRADEPSYDYSNDWRFNQTYASWLDVSALAPAAGLVGKPEELVALMQSLYFEHPEILTLPSVPGCREKKQGRCYSANLVIHDLPNGKRVGVQQGYLPGASSLLAIHTDGHILLVTSAGAPLESHHRERLEAKVLEVFN
ncbi:beta-lactamase family protein [Marinobacter sp. G11]|uniref:serine hydrolase domain-containing protein n=1 Tax=Marinobacter sp. G11 TaxID=2903522 RepID=UPI001E4424B4|nr:serine hydrolase domain-containing protein [Marinobacter sp. G11]MCE0760428.1 beta-lactamase family protein [Marinobacter sp. G11]